MRKNHLGFTLAELLVVVAMIGVLVGVSLPTFSEQIAKNQKATCIAQRKALYDEAVSAYLADPSCFNSSGIFTIPNDYSCPSGGTLTASRLSNGTFYVACSKHGTLHMEGLGSATGDTDILKQMIAELTSKNSSIGNVSNADSKCPVSISNYTNKIQAAFQELFTECNVVSWKVETSGGKYLLMITSLDIADYVGQLVKVIRYNDNSKTFTAAWVKIQLFTNPDHKDVVYPALMTQSKTTFIEIPGQNASTKSSYETTLPIYNAAPDVYPG